MADEEPTPSDEEPQGGTWKAPADQKELDAIIKNRLDRERAKFADYDDLKAKADEYDKTQQASKSDIEKATERATKAESGLSAESLRADRAEIALEKGLSLTQAKRLVGTTREELEADAEQLAKDLGLDKAKPPRVTDQHQKTTTARQDPLRETARALFGRED